VGHHYDITGIVVKPHAEGSGNPANGNVISLKDNKDHLIGRANFLFEISGILN
jgi:hypothetical protein